MSFLKFLMIALCSIIAIQTVPCEARRHNVNENQSFNSQASQDEFVYTILYKLTNKKDDGYYLEIGAAHPTITNNSYFFEKTLGWKGLSLDIDPYYTQLWEQVRSNPLIIQDATQADYRELLKSFPQQIDYLSLDIDHDYDTVLKRIPFDEHFFKIITIEHDYYQYGDKFRQGERAILSLLGYHLLCPDVMIFYNNQYCVFEDWWIHPSAFTPNLLSLLSSLDLKTKSHDQIIQTLQAASTHPRRHR